MRYKVKIKRGYLKFGFDFDNGFEAVEFAAMAVKNFDYDTDIDRDFEVEIVVERESEEDV